MSDKALIIGINKYPDCPLVNPVNDMNSIAELITTRCGFTMEQVRLLSDERATTEGIKDRLKWLVSDYQAGDRLIFYYSGHGSQIATRSQSGNLVALDCCICPVDFDFSPEHAITASQFKSIFSVLPDNALLYWDSDSCHSGGLARELSENPVKVRAFPVPSDYAWRIESAKRILDVRTFSDAIEHLHGAFVGACRADQTASDGFGHNGAYTEAKLYCYGQWGASSQVDLVKQINTRLQGQEAQLRGSLTAITRPWLSKI